MTPRGLRGGSVRVRITVGATALLTLALVVGGFGLVGLLRQGIIRSVKGDDLLRVAEIAALAQEGHLTAQLPALSASRLTFAQVVGPLGRVTAASAPLVGRPALVDPVGDLGDARLVRVAVRGQAERDWLIEMLPVTIGGRSARVIVLTSLADYSQSAALFTRLTVLVASVLVVLVASTTWVVVGRALRPIEAIRARVDQIGASGLDQRVPEPTNDDEVGRLARTMNEMLGRVEEAARRQRRFGEDAAHELRTPVANIRTALEVALINPYAAEWPDIARDVLVQDERMQSLIDELLVLARSDAGELAPARTRVDAAAIGAAVVAERDGGVLDVSFAADGPAWVEADPAHLARAITNIVDNAIRHAETAVRVEVSVEGGQVRIGVVDDGPGMAPGDRERVFERFVRLEDDRGRASGGTGLGLAIARELVSASGGTVTIDGPGPGATVVTRLPEARRTPPGPRGAGDSGITLSVASGVHPYPSDR